MLGHLGLGMYELEYLTHREIFNAYQAKVDEADQRTQLAWNVARWRVLTAENLARKPGKRLKAHQLAVFPWDTKQEKERIMTRKEQLEYQKKRYDKYVN